ncbi:MAG: sigma-70 family RNA polymerase sigma factor [Cyanobacteria bacterium]|nr:sigma-70 family RNA polymerase sigma factor [Cyanobacteriota bacterium]
MHRSRVGISGEEDAIAASDLAARVRAGDAAAEAELVARYRPGLMIMLRRLVKDRSLVDDYCQEVLRVTFEALRHDRIDNTHRLAAYLWGIARNLAHSDLRRHYRGQTTALSEAIVDSRERPEQCLLREERVQMLREALKVLAPRDRAVLSALYLQDTPKDEICRRMGLSPPQFDLIKCRALKRLQALVRERGGV